jgi:TRAP-type C4-dicarboxylate transport system substrate-binding protein
MSTSQAETAPIVGGFRDWAEAVERRTNGNLTIQIHTSNALGSDEDVIEQALMGGNVAVLTDGARMANYVRDLGIVLMPYLVDSYEEMVRIIETDTFKSWDAELISQGIRMLNYNWYDGPRNFWTNVPIRSPADLSGQRIRTPGAAVYSRTVANLGATPVAMNLGDTYNAIQTRAVDGIEQQTTGIFPSRMFEVVRIMTRTEHTHLANFIMVGERWFQTLPAEYQRILMEEAHRAATVNAAQILDAAAGFERQMVANHNVTINEIDKAPFIQASERTYEELGYRESRDRLWREIGKR